MRRTGSIPRRGRQESAASVSLFPFLAVLICTMGALILLLVVIARQARLQAAQTAAAEAADQDKDRKEALEDIQWRIGQLKISRQRADEQLADARLNLGHMEDHTRRLRDRLGRLQATLDDLDRSGIDNSQHREDLAAELAELKTAMVEAERRLADARQTAAQRQRSFAVVPYRGPHETYRRPIYMECREDSILLQPEGIELTAEDFEGPMGPGNPLAAAVRATREYLLAHGDFDPEPSGEPYPLLLVRPEGIMAYYAARGAMESWGSEFGYELIGEDWELDFRPSDPQLAKVVRRALDTARSRQDRLAAAAPRHYGGSRRRAYTVSRTRGSIVPYGGLASSRDPGFPRWKSREDSDGESAGGAAAQSQQASRSQRQGFGGAQSSGQEREGVSAGRQAEGSVAGQRPEGVVMGRPPQEQSQAAGEQGGVAMRPGEWRPGSALAAGQATGAEAGKHAESLAKSRGRNWGLPDTAGGSVPITRPIGVECHADRLVVAGQRGVSGSRSIPLGPRTEHSIDEFVSGVWAHMEGWGIAGRGMYWRPVLMVHVAPDAEHRFASLSALLEDSGLTVERR